MALLQQQLLMSRGITTATATATAADDSGLLPLPGNDVVEIAGSSSFKCPNPIDHGSVIPSLFNEFRRISQHLRFRLNQNQSQGNSNSQKQNFGAPVSVSTPSPAGPGSGGGGAAPAQPRQRVRARRGQATDPHSIAEDYGESELRRE
ncbi:bHLH transcription factor RHL1-like [Benincasa hispida]|uniref:bHLH transcription factor RHL1-like n=1 Tax=Benincasa hispida TaxID=102211 RepID=UPI0019010423|nr:bHLH transcription factor RHL1-like [Benincasa hispida]